MRSCRFRCWLLLALAAGLASCDLNPQPSLPVGSPGPASGSGGATGSSTPGASGSLNLNPGSSGNASDGASSGGVFTGLGGANGEPEGGAAPAQPGEGGAGGATDAGGAAGAAGAADAEAGPK